MELRIDAAVAQQFPELRVRVVIAEGVSNAGASSALEEAKRAAAINVAAHIDEILDSEEIASWREAYKAFGVKPKKHRPTAEAFLRRLARSQDFPTISKAVDSYLVAETEHWLPVGGYDLDRLEGNIVLRHSEGDEAFIGIGDTAEEATEKGEIIYVDDARVLTRRWNYRDCDHAKITTDTRRLALFVEAPYTPVDDRSLDGTARAISDGLVRFCDATVRCVALAVSEGRSVSLG